MTLLALLMVKLGCSNFYHLMPQVGFRPGCILLGNLFKDYLPIELLRLVGLALRMNNLVAMTCRTR